MQDSSFFPAYVIVISDDLACKDRCLSLRDMLKNFICAPEEHFIGEAFLL